MRAGAGPRATVPASHHNPVPRPRLTPNTNLYPTLTQTPKSVCITIGGFREAKYLGSYHVVAKCRRGFARLALETGASLVPVIGVGEAFIVGRAALWARVIKLMSP
jgi:hypothetical protein